MTVSSPHLWFLYTLLFIHTHLIFVVTLKGLSTPVQLFCSLNNTSCLNFQKHIHISYHSPSSICLYVWARTSDKHMLLSSSHSDFLVFVSTLKRLTKWMNACGIHTFTYCPYSTRDSYQLFSGLLRSMFTRR